MQAVFSPSAGFNPADRFHFASGRSYMMRSEKRGGSGPSHRSPAPGSRPPKKRRRAGFFYKLFMLILLLTIWPVGLMMLWQRKVRWSAVTKLLTSLVTLAACIILIGFALTVNTNNPRYTAVQDSVNSFLDTAADTLMDAGDIVADRAQFIYEGMSDLADAAWEYGKVHIANGIDAGVTIAVQVKAEVGAWIESVTAEKPAEEAQPSDLPEKGTPAPEAADHEDEAAETAPSASAETDEKAAATIEATAEPTEKPTPKPTATPEPTPEAHTFTVKSAANATVYYNDGGKCYHMASACASMKTSVEHKLGDTVGVNNHRCSICGTPEKSILDEEYIIWLDGESTAHLSDECTAFEGGWKLLPAAEAIEAGVTACYACKADDYMAALALEKTIILTDWPEPTEEPTEEPTAEPTEGPTEEPTEKPTEEPTEEPTAEPAETAAEEKATEAPVSEAPTLKPAEETARASTEAPTEKPTEVPTEEPTEEPTEKPTEEPTEEPTEAPTEEPTEDPTEIPTEEPTEAPTEKPTEIPTEEPTAEPTEAPTPEPTATPEPTLTPAPAATLKPAALATVYHSSNGKWYHTFNRCSGMTGGGAYTLEECVSGYKCCNACGAPKAEFVGKDCLWMDESGLCHTGDECPSFKGQYSLVLLENARLQAMPACPDCDADSYLAAVTVANTGEIVTVTAAAN